MSPGYAGRCPQFRGHQAPQTLTSTHFGPDYFGLLRENVFVSNWLNVADTCVMVHLFGVETKIGTRVVIARHWWPGSLGSLAAPRSSPAALL